MINQPQLARLKPRPSENLNIEFSASSRLTWRMSALVTMNLWFTLELPLSGKAKRGLTCGAAVCFAAGIVIAVLRPLSREVNYFLWICLCIFGLLLLIPVLFPNWVQRLCSRQEQELKKEPSEQIGRWVP